MNHELHHLAGAYAVDALDEHERRAFEAHYENCAVCRAEVDELRATAARLADAVAVAPPPSLKNAVMAEVAETRQVRPAAPAGIIDLGERRRRRRRLLAFGTAAAAAAVVAVIATVAVLRSGSPQPTVEQVAEAPDAAEFDLVAGEDAQGTLTVTWTPGDDRVAIVGTGLADPGSRLVYELWFLLDDGVAPAALFRPDDGDVQEVVEVDDLAAVGWGVTIEPEGGSASPTGPILYSSDSPAKRASA